MTLQDELVLFEMYMEDTLMLYNICKSYDISIIKTLYNIGTVSYTIMNLNNISQKIYFSYVVDEMNDDTYKLGNEIKILTPTNHPLDTPFNINDYSSYIHLYDLEPYIIWFSDLEKNCIIQTTPPS